MKLTKDQFGTWWLECTAFLATKSDEEYNRLSMINPVPDAVVDYYNLNSDAPQMWVYDDAALKVSDIIACWEGGVGIMVVDIGANYDYRVLGCVRELLDLLKTIKADNPDGERKPDGAYRRIPPRRVWAKR